MIFKMALFNYKNVRKYNRINKIKYMMNLTNLYNARYITSIEIDQLSIVKNTINMVTIY